MHTFCAYAFKAYSFAASVFRGESSRTIIPDRTEIGVVAIEFASSAYAVGEFYSPPVYGELSTGIMAGEVYA